MQTMTLKMRETMSWAGRNRLSAAALAIAWALALVSIVQGFRNAVRVSTDFQWSPTVLLSEGVNPYQVALSGNVDGRLLLCALIGSGRAGRPRWARRPGAAGTPSNG